MVVLNVVDVKAVDGVLLPDVLWLRNDVAGDVFGVEPGTFWSLSVGPEVLDLWLLIVGARELWVRDVDLFA